MKSIALVVGVIVVPLFVWLIRNGMRQQYMVPLGAQQKRIREDSVVWVSITPPSQPDQQESICEPVHRSPQLKSRRIRMPFGATSQTAGLQSPPRPRAPHELPN